MATGTGATDSERKADEMEMRVVALDDDTEAEPVLKQDFAAEKQRESNYYGVPADASASSVQQLDSKHADANADADADYKGGEGIVAPVVVEQSSAQEQDVTRKGWGSKIEFFIAMLGTCVGLGNVWRFPYVCFKNGGGAFLIPYVIMMFAIGLPVFYLETALGQFATRSAINIFQFSPLFKGLGYGMLVVIFLIAIFYNVLNAQFLYYFFLSMQDPLPWTYCSDWWGASPCCTDCLTIADRNCAPYTRNNQSHLCPKLTLAAEEFYDYVIQRSSGIEDFGYPVWQLSLCLLAIWVIVTLALLRGAQSFGKVAYFTSLFPYVMLVVMLIRGATLEGAGEGVLYFITPVFERLADPTVWQDAAGQVFFSVSVASGGCITLASYNSFDHPVLRDALLIIVMDLLTSLLSGCVVFTVLGFMSEVKDVTIDKVVTAGPGLVFEVYPSALSLMPVAPLWAILFFLMMLTLGLGSGFTQCETIQLSLQDAFPSVLRSSKRRQIVSRVCICAILFLFGFPMTFTGGIYLLTLIDHSTGAFALLFIGLAECLVVQFVYGWRRFRDDIRFMTGSAANWYFVVCWAIVSPVLLVVMIVLNIVQYQNPSYKDYVFPEWAIGITVVIIVLPIITLPIYALYYYLVPMKGWLVCREAARPQPGWGPLEKDIHARYDDELGHKYEFQSMRCIADAYDAEAARAAPADSAPNSDSGNGNGNSEAPQPVKSSHVSLPRGLMSSNVVAPM